MQNPSKLNLSLLPWQPAESAPKDGTMLRLHVLFEENAVEDDDGNGITIGFNSLENTGEDIWEIAGWDWSHDKFTAAKGKVMGWLPLTPETFFKKTTIAPKPIKWDDKHPENWYDSVYGFHITYDANEEPENQYSACWGEGDSESLESLEAAQEWCQEKINEWVESFVDIKQELIPTENQTVFAAFMQLGLPQEFLDICSQYHTNPNEVLMGFIADLCDLRRYADTPQRPDNLHRNGSDEARLADEYFTRVGYPYREAE